MDMYILSCIIYLIISVLSFDNQGTYRRYKKHYQDKNLILVCHGGHSNINAMAMGSVL